MTGLDTTEFDAIAQAIALIKQKGGCTVAELRKIWEDSGAKGAGISLLGLMTALEKEGFKIDLDRGVYGMPEQRSLSTTGMAQAPLITYETAIDEALHRIKAEVTEDREWSLAQTSRILTEVAEKHDMDPDTLTRRTLTEDRVGFKSFNGTGRMLIEGKEMGPVLNAEEAKNRAAYACCVVDVFRDQSADCIEGLKESRYKLRGHRVVDEQGEPVSNCYNPYAVCRASVFGEYAQEDRLTSLIAEALGKAGKIASET